MPMSEAKASLSVTCPLSASSLMAELAASWAVLRAMSDSQRAALADYGVLMLATLRYGFARWGPHCEAIFTCCGDARALETTPKLGFVATPVQFLLVHWMRELTPRRQQELIAKAKSFMPF